MLKNAKVSTQLGLAFAMLILLGLLQAGYGWSSLGSLAEDLTLVTEDRMVKFGQLADMKDNANVVARAVRNMVLLKDPAEIQKEKARIDEARAKTAALLDALTNTIHSEDGKADLKGIQETRAPYNGKLDSVMELAVAHKEDEATAMLLKEVRPLQSAHFKALDAASALQREKASQLGRQASARAGRAVRESRWDEAAALAERAVEFTMAARPS